MNPNKTITDTNEYTKELYRLYNLLNNKFYGGELPEVMLTIVPTLKAYGHVTTTPAWVSTSEDREKMKYEVNISGYTISRDTDQVCATLLHEMAHLYNITRGIRDTSARDQYHNRYFKEVAEAHGLECVERGRYGYSETVLNSAGKRYVHTIHPKKFDYRHVDYEPKDSDYVRWICPGCLDTYAYTYNRSRPHNLLCAKCMLPLRQAEKGEKRARTERS